MPGFSAKPILIDGAGHLLGRLAAIVAKTTLTGQRVVVVRCEKNQYLWLILPQQVEVPVLPAKRCNVNPKRGPFHHRAPAKIFQRTVRGMLPYKTKRGQEALKRLKSFEGVPPPYDKSARKVVPDALRIMRLKPGRKYCFLGRLSHEVGWKYKSVVSTLETRRKLKAAVLYKKRLTDKKLRRQALAKVSKRVEPYTKVMVSYGVEGQ